MRRPPSDPTAPRSRTVLTLALLVLAVPVGFVVTVAALHMPWPRIGFVPHLDKAIAIALTAMALAAVVFRAPPPAIAPLAGLAIGAGAVAWIFGGFISV